MQNFDIAALLGKGGSGGVATGVVLGMRITGVSIVAYGIAYYAEKTAIVKDEAIKYLVAQTKLAGEECSAAYL